MNIKDISIFWKFHCNCPDSFVLANADELELIMVSEEAFLIDKTLNIECFLVIKKHLFEDWRE